MWVPRVLLLAAVFSIPAFGHSQVFVVGEKTATDDLPTDFTPTDLALPSERLSERGRRGLVRDLNAEQGFAHRALPLGKGLTLMANGPLQQTTAEYKKMIYTKGESVAPGDRVVITALEIKGDRLIIDLNGGPYAKHRFLSHIQFNDNNVAQNQQQATGSRVTLAFEGGIPEITAPEVKALLSPVIDFGVKSSVQAYADTLPSPVKKAIAQHDVLVGMDHRMVLAALGAPESKVREHSGDDPSQARYEEWIYGEVPKTIKFVRFTGDRVTQVKIAAMGKPIEIHDKDEMSGFQPPDATHEVVMADAQPGEERAHIHQAPPTLRKEGEAAPANAQGKVQFPDEKPQPIPATPRGDSGEMGSAPMGSSAPTPMGSAPMGPTQVGPGSAAPTPVGRGGTASEPQLLGQVTP
ncbi:hypothetical protein [Granulicella sibirica]|uniref:Uncharacterized protein n=1 Tax=Granulicella sibirica TaxID=2479048 RepID=A0A4Q0T1R0_9BACT|nr:hypothetical protein [Granulicella sibirica]RXH55839.1 hypothetical protein GRAN_2696 [Granulicella sibirica]